MDIKKIKSDLCMDNIYFRSYSFSRNEQIINKELNADLNKKIKKIKDHVYEVVLELSINNDDLKLEVTAVAQFTYNAEDYSKENDIINSNTVAIMFPFIRSQVSLMTTQPGMVPIILPAINTRKLVK